MCRPEIRPSRALVIAMLLLFSDTDAQARQMGQATVWELMAGRDSVTQAELEFVRQLDEAWSKGSASAVHNLFSFKHPQMARDLAARVNSTTGGKPCSRTSKVLARSQKGRFLCLYLSAELQLPGAVQRPGAGGSKNMVLGKAPVQAELFEILVFATDDKGRLPKAILLLETTRELQSGVSAARSVGSPEIPGLPLGYQPGFACMACNYQVRAPKEGNWLVVAKPRFLSGNLEAIEIISLDEDLTMEVTLVPIRQTKLPTELAKAKVEQIIKLTAEGLIGMADRKQERVKILEQRISEGLHAYTTTIQLEATSGSPRYISLFGFRHGALNYILSFQGASEAQEGGKKTIASLLGSFRFLVPGLSETEGLAILNDLHGGGGRFQDNRYVVESLGLILAGPLDWQTSIQTGVSEFCGEWCQDKTGSFMRIRGIERKNSPWNDNAMVDWVKRWFDMNGRTLAGLQSHGKLKSRKLETSKGLRKGMEIEYRYSPRPNPHKTASGEGMAHGRLILIPLGKLLIVVNAVANPSEDQAKVLATLEEHIASLKLD